MGFWIEIVDLIRATVFSAAHVLGGSLGAGVFAVSISVRLALLPVTLRAMRRVREHQQRVSVLAPELAKIQKRHAGDRARAGQETLALYARHGIPMMPKGTMSSALVQMPVGAALYQAVSRGLGKGVGFLWVRDLSAPDLALAGIAAALAGVAALGTTGAPSRTGFLLSSAITLVIAWRLSAAVGLYWVASNTVNAAQTLVLRRSASAPR